MAANFGAAIEALDQSKAPVWCKFRVACEKERERDGLMLTSHHPPKEVAQDNVVFVLASTIVCVEVCICLPKAMNLEIMVQLTHYTVGTLSGVDSFITEVCDLPWDGFTV
jgi:hypothetical protein